MRFFADLHIHSHYARACSRQLVPEHLDHWSRMKGLQVLGTGDCIHPAWLDELKEKLEPAGNGLYRLKTAYRLPEVSRSRFADAPVYFMLTTEISTIYKKGGKVRKVHTLCMLPDFEAADKLQERLAAVGNIASDGRPILGLDCKHLLEEVLTCADSAYVIPAHIWTPWFSVLGSKSGFDSLEECFEDLTGEIFAVETGLSSDPAMNRLCRFLDNCRLVSNSDAHSPENIGREANIFDTALSYQGIANALKYDKGFWGTVEFFPQEGKYHHDGHRKCGISWTPLQTLERGGLCTVCGKPVTRGVLHRVAELADRERPPLEISDQKYHSLAPLPELIAEIQGVRGTQTKTVQNLYHRLLHELGSEFDILLSADPGEVRKAGGEALAEGLRRMREGRVWLSPGYDGEYGRVRVFRDKELDALKQSVLFTAPENSIPAAPQAKGSVDFNVQAFQRLSRGRQREEPAAVERDAPAESANAEQREAITCGPGVCRVVAGPGSGKTHVLTERIIDLVAHRGIEPAQILALTFSNKAADEMSRRITAKAGKLPVEVSTFHALGLSILKECWEYSGRTAGFLIADEDHLTKLLVPLLRDCLQTAPQLLRRFSAFKQGTIERLDDAEEIIFSRLQDLLRQHDLVDLDDLIWLTVKLFEAHAAVLRDYRERWRWISVDEFQDINPMQYRLVRLLAGEGNPNLFVIGDPNQAIYGFRGSEAGLMERLHEDYPLVKTIRLQHSYRCPAPVLEGAGQVLGVDELRGRPGGLHIHIQECPSEASEADWIAAHIESLLGGVRSFSRDSGITDGEAAEGITGFGDFAVLCRTSDLFEPFIQAFKDHGIAYQIVGRQSYLQAEPFRSLLEDLRGALISMEQGLTAHTARQLMWVEAMRAQVPLAELLRDGFDAGAVEPWHLRNWERLLQGYGCRYREFLNAARLGQPVDDWRRGAAAVSLMTLHASKGLEFEAVFIPACEEGLLPFTLFGNKDEEAMAEEERLFYVGMTRTRRCLILTHAKQRRYKGRTLQPRRSELLDRLERRIVEEARREAKPRPDAEQLRLF